MSDQATKLRELAAAQRRRPRIVTVTSGKGGVGKTSILVNLAIALAQRKHRVIVLDADLGLANVDILLGLKPEFTLQHVVDGAKSLHEILIEGPMGVRVIPGCSGIPRIANLSARKRRELLKHFGAIEAEADYLMIDTSAGLGRNVVEFAAAADDVIIVTTPEPSAVADAYAMIKALHDHKAPPAIRLVINNARSRPEAIDVAEKIVSVSREFLQYTVKPLGYVLHDDQVRQAIMAREALLARAPRAAAARAVRTIAEVLDTGGEAAIRDRGGLLARLNAAWRGESRATSVVTTFLEPTGAAK